VDETPEELEQIRREAQQIDVYKYRRRWRGFLAIVIGMAGAGAVWLVLEMKDKGRNPCARVKDYVCAKSPGFECTTYTGIFEESEQDKSAEMRRNIRAQCERKIRNLAEDGEKVP
jgi:hypothetical protein